MHIKTINTDVKYKCIIVGHNNPVWVDRKKGYGVVRGNGGGPESTKFINLIPPTTIALLLQ